MIDTEAGGRRQRVRALSAEERRRALIAATIPLVREHGMDVSTRQIADAAGVAEGTIFGVFKDKASLLRAAVVAGMDPAPLLQRIKTIDPVLPLRTRLVAAAHAVREHIAGHGALLYVVRGPLFADDRQAMVDIMATRFLVFSEIATLIEPDAALLRRSPGIAARMLMSLVGTPRGAFGSIDEALDDDEVVSIVLDGLLVRPAETPSPETRSPETSSSETRPPDIRSDEPTPREAPC